MNFIPCFIGQMSDSMYTSYKKTANTGQDPQICKDICPRSALKFGGRGENFSWGPTIKYPVDRHENTRARTHTGYRRTEKCIKGDLNEIKDLVPTIKAKTKAFQRPL